MYVGIDQSKRSTAVVAIDDDGTLVDFMLICPPMILDEEVLIEYIYDNLKEFIYKHPLVDLKGIALEGLSFGSIGSGKDILCGVYWYIRTRLMVEFEYIPVGSIPCLSWRAKAIPKEERQAISKLKIKDGIKIATVGKLPYEVKIRFEKYILDNNYKSTAIYDLADAYFISQYRRGLD